LSLKRHGLTNDKYKMNLYLCLNSPSHFRLSAAQSARLTLIKSTSAIQQEDRYGYSTETSRREFLLV
jgi:hypothetical protein